MSKSKMKFPNDRFQASFVHILQNQHVRSSKENTQIQHSTELKLHENYALNCVCSINRTSLADSLRSYKPEEAL